MKRTLALVLLLVFSVMSLSAADVDFGGDLGWFFTADEDDTDRAGNIGKLRLKMSVAVDDYNSLYFEMRNDTRDTTVYDGLTWNTAAITTDLSGALGVDTVGIETKFGIYEEWFSHWNAVSSAHRNRSYVQTSSWAYGTDLKAKVKADFGVAAASVLFIPGQGKEAWGVMGFALENGSDFPVDGVNFIGKYMMHNEDDTNYGAQADFFAFDAGYSMMAGDISLTFPFGMLSAADLDQMDLGVGVIVGYDMLTVGVETLFMLGDDSKDTLGNLDITASYKVSDAATVYVNSYNNLGIHGEVGIDGLTRQPNVKLSDTDFGFMQAIDLGAKYSVGATTFYAGYVIAGSEYDIASTKVAGDDSTGRFGVTGSGFYLAARASF